MSKEKKECNPPCPLLTAIPGRNSQLVDRERTLHLQVRLVCDLHQQYDNLQMGFFELVAVSATETLVDGSLATLAPAHMHALQFTRTLIDCLYLYNHDCTLMESYYGIRRLAPSKKTLLIVYLVERVLQSRYVDLMNYITRLLYVVEATPYWSLVQCMGRVKFASTQSAKQNVLVAGALVGLRLQHWLQSNNMSNARRPPKVIHPPPPPTRECIICGETVMNVAELRLTEAGQLVHEWCTSKTNDANFRTIKLS